MPDSVAFFGRDITIYWHGIFFAAAFLLTFIVAQILWTANRERPKNSGLAVCSTAALGVIIGLPLSRLQYCYFNPEVYSEDLSKVFELSNGGFGLLFGMAGVLLAAVIVSKQYGLKLSMLLDALSPAAALGICVGRAASYFSGDDLGVIVHAEKWHMFPFSVFVESTDSWQLCVYPFEALAAFIAFAASLSVFIGTYAKKPRAVRTGDAFAVFVLIFSTFQIMLESWRNDALFLNVLGFVRITQVLCSIFLAAVLVVGSVRLCKQNGFKWYYLLLWAAAAGMFTLAFFMEFRLTSGTLIRNYSWMLFALCIIGLITLYTILSTRTYIPVASEKQQAQPAAEAHPAVYSYPMRPVPITLESQGGSVYAAPVFPTSAYDALLAPAPLETASEEQPKVSAQPVEEADGEELSPPTQPLFGQLPADPAAQDTVPAARPLNAAEADAAAIAMVMDAVAAEEDETAKLSGILNGYYQTHSPYPEGSGENH